MSDPAENRPPPVPARPTPVPSAPPANEPMPPNTDTETPKVAITFSSNPSMAARTVRFTKRFTLLLVIPALLVMAAGYWYLTTGRYVTTENAYVKSHIVAVSPSIDGRVVDVLVTDNEPVAKGDVLFRLNPVPHEIAVDRATAQLDASRQEIERRRAEFRQVQAEIAEADERVAFHQREFDRQNELASRGVATKASLEEAEFNLLSAKQTVSALLQKAQTTLASLGGDTLKAAELHPLYNEAEAELRQAELLLGYTEVRAKSDGVVSQMQLQPGEWVEEGEPVFGIIESGTVWIEANLKETKLTHIREGQSVEVAVDAYPGESWPGTVGSISPATGAEFALLPAQNATGNWVKVVQRLPVRVEILEFTDRPPLRAGMTATVTVDTEQDKRFETVWPQTVERVNIFAKEAYAAYWPWAAR